MDFIPLCHLAYNQNQIYVFIRTIQRPMHFVPQQINVYCML